MSLLPYFAGLVCTVAFVQYIMTGTTVETDRVMEETSGRSPRPAASSASDKSGTFGTNFSRQQWETRVSNEMMRSLATMTGFSDEELWKYLETFSTVARRGKVNEGAFKAIFSRFVPSGAENAVTSAFRAADTDNDGYVNFQDFVYSLRMATDEDVLDRMTWALKLMEATGVYNLPFSRATSLLKDVVRLSNQTQLERNAVDDAKDILYAADKSGGNIDVPKLIDLFSSAATMYQQSSGAKVSSPWHEENIADDDSNLDEVVDE